MHKVLVIIVTYNAMNWLDKCLSSIDKSTVSCDVIVIDNGSTDETVKTIKEKYRKVQLVESETNLGFGKANNIGLQRALDNQYDYVYLLNQDAWIMPDTIEKLIAISKKYPDYGIISPFQMEADLRHIDKNFVKYTCDIDSNGDIIADLYNNTYQEIYPVKFVMAAHWFMPIAFIKAVGGFSPSFPHYGEDENYVARVLYKGAKVGVTPLLRVVHDRGWREETKQKKMYLGYVYFIKEMSKPQNPIFKSLIRSSYVAFRDTLMFVSLTPFMFYFKNIFHLKKTLKNREISMKQDGAFLSVERCVQI